MTDAATQAIQFATALLLMLEAAVRVCQAAGNVYARHPRNEDAASILDNAKSAIEASGVESPGIAEAVPVEPCGPRTSEVKRE
jgi:hypothetical protein